MMRRNTLNYVVDVISLLVVFDMAGTGLVIKFVLPPGTGGRHGHGGQGLVLWGLGRHDWGDIHFWLAVAMGILVIAHVALHWAWVTGTTRRLIHGDRAGTANTTSWSRNSYGMGFLVLVIAVFAVFLWTAYANVQTVVVSPYNEKEAEQSNQSASVVGDDTTSEPAPRVKQSERAHTEKDREEHKRGAEQIRGSMTLEEVEALSGVSISVLKTQLGLPKSVGADERLGRLGRKYSFKMPEVRDILDRYLQQAPADH